MLPPIPDDRPLSPDQVHALITQALAERGFGPTEVERFLKQYGWHFEQLATITSEPLLRHEITNCVHAWQPAKPANRRGLPKEVLAENKARGLKVEKEVATCLDGQVVPGSGSGTVQIGDVLTLGFLIQSKSTNDKSFRLTVELIDQTCREARQQQRDPAIAVTFTGDLPPRTPATWTMIPIEVFKRLLADRRGK